MATTNICILCKKGTRMAGGDSNRVRATKFNPTGNKRKYPNLQWVALPKAAGGGRMKICTRCMKAGKQMEMTRHPMQKQKVEV